MAAYQGPSEDSISGHFLPHKAKPSPTTNSQAGVQDWAWFSSAFLTRLAPCSAHSRGSIHVCKLTEKSYKKCHYSEGCLSASNENVGEKKELNCTRPTYTRSNPIVFEGDVGTQISRGLGMLPREMHSGQKHGTHLRTCRICNISSAYSFFPRRKGHTTKEIKPYSVSKTCLNYHKTHKKFFLVHLNSYLWAWGRGGDGVGKQWRLKCKKLVDDHGLSNITKCPILRLNEGQNEDTHDT